MRDNILKDVYANDKIELSSIEINLASLKDLDALLNEGNKQIQFGFDSLMKIKSIFQDAKTGYRQAAIRYTDALKVADDIAAQVKALGLEMPGAVLAKQTLLKNNIKDATAEIVKLQNVEKLL